jgi:aspartate/methionine/tyrosine aminotransferase
MRRADVRLPAFRRVPRTGVIYVMTEAARAGFEPRSDEWCNLGQGMPETGALPGGPPRMSTLEIDPGDLEYAPVAGIPELRETVAAFYNAVYRRGLPSQYAAENVAIAGGGRAALTRVAAALGHINLGHFLPDYTAYEELLEIFRAFTSIPILLEPEREYGFHPSELRREVLGRGLGAVLLSNPANPTGKVIQGDSLEAWVAAARDLDCALLLDEFYSHYIWTDGAAGVAPMVSAARYVEDVNRDPVIVMDGLTKNWRYPGFRVSWILGPRELIDSVASAGSFLDGGGSRPLQRAAVELVTPELAAEETTAIQGVFRAKRDTMVERLRALGIRLDLPPQGTFYCWGSVADLPGPLSTGMGFFRAGLQHKVITVPGQFFDVNPGKRRLARASRFWSHVRFSFGPPMAVVRSGLDRLEGMLAAD